ncbi:hypothetical protein HYFRA_00010501 [Hymenoscyphus fraxineus]|uniref:Uncharacterized protein n=1 Tax=Hymenoscyphus fraxineus TaxID=746836 RepID=A0A9N9PKX8_9HELO|nr:hypothetical protein HYFRA_00010501 [Hymenoscyphus fraxineus]
MAKYASPKEQAKQLGLFTNAWDFFGWKRGSRPGLRRFTLDSQSTKPVQCNTTTDRNRLSNIDNNFFFHDIDTAKISSNPVHGSLHISLSISQNKQSCSTLSFCQTHHLESSSRRYSCTTLKSLEDVPNNQCNLDSIGSANNTSNIRFPSRPFPADT